MTREERITQTKVGIFILIGLVTIGMLVVYFGRLGESVSSSYSLRVEFSNASGLLRGAEVQLAGAKIGRVGNDPTILPNMEGVYVDLRIFDAVKIPSACQFSIGSSGLLGDKFVQIDLKPGGKSSPPIAPDTTIKGAVGSGGLGGMAEDAGTLVAELRTTVGNINSVVKKLDDGILSDEGVTSLKETLKNLQTTSKSLASASANVDKVVTQADSAIQSGKGTMDSAKKAADELQRALADIRGLIREVRQGQGALGTLITNRETADNLRSLVSNLRRYGILWYRDGEKAKSPAPER
ncbi:MAG: MlaD family protein [Verrucomicrobiae bacterium]